MRDRRRLQILLVEDDPEDQWVTKRAFRALETPGEITVVENGIQALDFLHRKASFAEPADRPNPDLILLDLNLPMMDGQTVLREIKSDPALCRIPIVILTTSSYQKDVADCYGFGANSFITKPVNLISLTEAVKDICHYWLELVHLPDNTFTRNGPS